MTNKKKGKYYDFIPSVYPSLAIISLCLSLIESSHLNQYLHYLSRIM